MDHTNHVRLTTTELVPDTLEGATVYGADDAKVGKVDHVHGIGDLMRADAKPVVPQQTCELNHPSDDPRRTSVAMRS